MENGFCDQINNKEECKFDGGDCICSVPYWIGDGFCDHVANNEICDFDGGDCSYLEDFSALTTIPSEESDEICAENMIWIGDNFCDDNLNIAQCNYDEGDCCEPHTYANWQIFCTDCQCHGEASPVMCLESWINDGYCDDANNFEECDFDGNDCCQSDANPSWDEFCDECTCKDLVEHHHVGDGVASPVACMEPWISDGYCDDENNFEECDFDGNDCCQPYGSDLWNKFCTDCQCHQKYICCLAFKLLI